MQKRPVKSFHLTRAIFIHRKGHGSISTIIFVASSSHRIFNINISPSPSLLPLLLTTTTLLNRSALCFSASAPGDAVPGPGEAHKAGERVVDRHVILTVLPHCRAARCRWPVPPRLSQMDSVPRSDALGTNSFLLLLVRHLLLVAWHLFLEAMERSLWMCGV